MAGLPQYLKEGWSPRGPGRCKCPHCGATVSTNALARARHKCSPPLPKTETESDR